MTTTLVHLVRHGEVENPNKILYGRLPDWHLSQRGQEMARLTAKSFAGHNVKFLAASPLERAQETAAPIAVMTGQAIQTDERLIEAGNTLEGLHIKGWDSDLWQPKLWPRLLNPFKPSWGEPYQEILVRMMAAVEAAKELAFGGEAILVSHQLPIVTVQRLVQGRPLAHVGRQCNLASVTTLVFEDDDLADWVYSEPASSLY